MKYGGITLFASPSVVTSTSLLPFRAEFLLSGDGATNSQLGLLDYKRVNSYMSQGTAAVNSTANQALQVTVQWDGGNANNIVRLKHAVLELVK